MEFELSVLFLYNYIVNDLIDRDINAKEAFP